MVANRNMMIESFAICPRMCGRLEPNPKANEAYIDLVLGQFRCMVNQSSSLLDTCRLVVGTTRVSCINIMKITHREAPKTSFFRRSPSRKF